jgi:hypothetical protein
MAERSKAHGSGPCPKGRRFEPCCCQHPSFLPLSRVLFCLSTTRTHSLGGLRGDGRRIGGAYHTLHPHFSLQLVDLARLFHRADIQYGVSVLFTLPSPRSSVTPLTTLAFSRAFLIARAERKQRATVAHAYRVCLYNYKILAMVVAATAGA